MSQRQAFTDALGKDMAGLLWTANTLQIYPATLQDFSVGSLLPAVIYMFRRGFRRGQGGFATKFSPSGLRPDIWCVAGCLSQMNRFEGFESEVAKDILGDLLLVDSLENKGGAEGQRSEVRRAFPVHFYASWLDLPPKITDLRFVPEMIVAILANQKNTVHVAISEKEDFSVQENPSKNPLLKVFSKGVIYGGNAGKLSGNEADQINESANFSVEEWLMVQLGRACGQAPERVSKKGGEPSISANQPLARQAASVFRDDMAGLLMTFGTTIPRRGLSSMLECLIGLGIWHTYLASLNTVVYWERHRKLPENGTCGPFQMLADASSGSDTRLRDLAEASGSEFQKFINEATVALAVFRVMDAAARFNEDLESYAPKPGETREWLDLLGSVRNSIHPDSAPVIYSLKEKCKILLRNLKIEDEESECCRVLQTSLVKEDPARALAESLAFAMGTRLLQRNYFTFADSAGMVSEPHGLIKKRKTSRRSDSGKTQRGEARSVVLSNALLDTVVHTLVSKHQAHASFRDLLNALKFDYGILIDEAPQGVAADLNELHRNRDILEKRLRDLGLLVGVNDAESMKRLRPRYNSSEKFRK